MFDDAFLIVFPVFTYSLEPGGQQGLLLDVARRRQMVPVWTDEDLFARFAATLSSSSCRRTVEDAARFAWLLRAVRPAVQHLIVDPSPSTWQSIRIWEIDGFLAAMESA